jgi:hypothetical protein
MYQSDVEALEQRISLSAPPGPAAAGVDAAVAARHIFYNHSAFDGANPSPNPADDNAIAPDKTPLLPGQPPSPAHYSTFSHGINGVMIDVAGLASAPAAEDFVFRVGGSPGASTWTTATPPTSITVRAGAGANGSDRITVIWPTGSVRNQWLQVTLLETDRTGLPAPDVFYVGNLVGDTSDAPLGATARVSAMDVVRTRADRTARRTTVGLGSRSDHNRDGRVNAKDLLLVRRNRALPGRGGTLQLSAAPPEPPVYYVSPSGDDSNDGLSPVRPWRTVAKVNVTSLSPGARVLFMRGGEWREQLRPSSSGTPSNPVVFGSYGSGLRPKFWGSDVLAPASFQPVDGEPSVYQVTMPDETIVNSVQADHSFLRSAYLAARKPTDPAAARAYVTSNPGSWHFDDSGMLYVNTGGIDPRAETVTYTASVRENVVLLQFLHDVRVRNLVVDESAKFEGGYAFAAEESNNITIEDSEAYRAGKHHFGALNTHNFVGRRLYSAWAMPDQGDGSASAYVSYGDFRFPDQSSQWVDIASVELPSNPYLAFYTHGLGMGDVTIQDLVSRGGWGVAIKTEGLAPQQVRMTGGLIEDGRLTLQGHDILVDGVTIRGRRSGLAFTGNRNVVQNAVLYGVPENPYFGAVVDDGRDNTVRFSTIRVDPATPALTAAVTIVKPDSRTRLYGNIIDARRAVMLWFEGPGTFSSDRNLFAQAPTFFQSPGLMTLEQWRSLGYDISSNVGDPLFVNAVAGDFHLSAGSAAIDAYADWSLVVWTDLDGRPRPQGMGFDIGAFEFPQAPGPAAATASGADAPSVVIQQRRRR